MALVIPPYSDKFGRRKITILCMLLQLPVIIGLYFSTSYWLTCLCFFSLGCLSGGRVMVQFTFMSELFSMKTRGWASTFKSFFEC